MDCNRFSLDWHRHCYCIDLRSPATESSESDPKGLAAHINFNEMPPGEVPIAMHILKYYARNCAY